MKIGYKKRFFSFDIYHATWKIVKVIMAYTDMYHICITGKNFIKLIYRLTQWSSVRHILSSYRIILNIFRVFWVCLGSFRHILAYLGSFRLIWAHLDSLELIKAHLSSFRLIQTLLGLFTLNWALVCHLYSFELILA